MVEGPWPGFCLVGFGRHARNQLLPAIEANGQALVGLVSRQSAHARPDAPIFPSVEQAINAVPPHAAFLIASPPHMHLAHCLPALRAGRDVLVEKPAFVSVRETRAAADAAANAGAILGEAFMHRYTCLYRRFLEDWSTHRSDVEGIEIEFVLPSLPPGTFRQGTELHASVLYDIGCYALSLLADLGLPVGGLALNRADRAGTFEELLFISERCGDVDVHIEIGVDGRYENAVTLRRAGAAVRYSPFFSGRAGERTIIDCGPGPGQRREERIDDVSGFMTMLATARATWAHAQDERMDNMILVAEGLEQLGAQLLALRATQ